MSTEALTSLQREFLARELLRDNANAKYAYAQTAAEVPEACGHFAIYRRIHVSGAGLTYNLRNAFPGQRDSMRGTAEPDLIFLYKLDDDGSAARWLDRAKIMARKGK